MPNKDPLGLFPEPTTAQAAPVSDARSGGWRQFVVGLLIGVFAFWAYNNRADFGRWFDRGDGDRQEEGEVVTDGAIIFLHERMPPTPEHVELLRQMPEWKAKTGIAWEAFDDDLPEFDWVLQWAKAKGVEPPMAVYADKDKKPVRVIPFPASIDELNQLIRK